MYVAQDIASRIREGLKANGFSMKQMLCDLNMGINSISELSKGKQLSYISLAKIADYLQCSVDYLLGRDNYVDYLSPEQAQVISAYISQPEMQDAVKKLLGIDDNAEQEVSTFSDYASLAALGGEETRPPRKTKRQIT